MYHRLTEVCGVGKGPCNSKENDVNGNICLPSLWKPIATSPSGPPHYLLIPMGTGTPPAPEDPSFYSFSSPQSRSHNSLLKSYARQYNLMSFQIVPHLPLHPQRRWPPPNVLSKFNSSPIINSSSCCWNVYFPLHFIPLIYCHKWKRLLWEAVYSLPQEWSRGGERNVKNIIQQHSLSSQTAWV